MGVTYANLDVRDDLMETSIIEPINTTPGTRGSPGARFSNNLLQKSRSPSPEVLGGSKYIQYMAMPGREAYKPPVVANPQVPVRPPNENIMKIDNFISNLLKVGDDPQMKEMIFGDPRKYAQEKIRSKSKKREQSPPKFKQFMADYDA